MVCGRAGMNKTDSHLWTEGKVLQYYCKNATIILQFYQKYYDTQVLILFPSFYISINLSFIQLISHTKSQNMHVW